MRSLVGDTVLVRLQEERDPLLHKRLYNALRRAILDGSLAPQSRLPPSRDGGRTWRIKKHHINNL